MASFPASNNFDSPFADGCRPIASSILSTSLAGMASFGRALRYASWLKGTTVFNPSLPPVSCTTTRIVSFLPFDSAAAACAKNFGTGPLKERTADAPASEVKNVRRDVFMVSLLQQQSINSAETPVTRPAHALL